MSSVQLVADTNVISYVFRGSTLGLAYAQLIRLQNVGITGSCLAELRAGAVLDKWGERKLEELVRFLEQFTHVPDSAGMAEVCGALRGLRARIGQQIDWPDAWAAACALWLDVPLVTHDRDLERIPGLRVLTLHKGWQIRDESSQSFACEVLGVGEAASPAVLMTASRPCSTPRLPGCPAQAPPRH